MRNRIILAFAIGLASLAARSAPIASAPEVPRVWDDDAMRELELPLAARIPVHHMTAEYYYRIPTQPNVKTYPIYAPGREPSGYWTWLPQQEPQPAFDPQALRTPADWINAGRLVFDAPKDFNPVDDAFTDVRNPKWYEYTGIRLAKNGELPYYRYVIRKKGVVEVNLDSCNECHTRVLDDGTIVRGAQGNVPFGRIFSYNLLHTPSIDTAGPARRISSLFFGAPWIRPDPTAPLADRTVADLAAPSRRSPKGSTRGRARARYTRFRFPISSVSRTGGISITPACSSTVRSST